MTDSNTFKGHGKVSVTRATIISLSSEQSIDLRRMITNIDIYGSIFDPTMVAVISLMDTTSTLYNLPVVGEEIVELEIETDGNEPMSKVFFVHRPEEIQFDPNGSSTSMVLHLISIDQMRAVATKVNLGVKGQLSVHVQHILKDIVRVDDRAVINLEETEGIESIVFPGWNAWESIEFMRKRAVSTKYKSPYLFFEDSKGYCFESAEALIERKKKDKPPETYTVEPFVVEASSDPNKHTVIERQVRNVENFKILSKGNTFQLLNNGGLKNKVQSFNMIRKEVVEVITGYEELKENVRQPLDASFNPQNSSRIKEILGDNTEDYYMSVDNSNLTSSVENHGRQTMFARHMGTLRVSFTMYGNSELDPGDLIRLEIPLTTGSPDEDPQLTGNYIITEFCHHIKDGLMFTDAEACRLGLATSVMS